MEIKSKIVLGSITLDQQQRELLNQKFRDQQVLVTIEKLPLKRSEALSRYYYGVVVSKYWLPLFKELADEKEKMLHNKESTHYWLTKQYSPVQRKNPMTGEIEIVGSLQRKMTNDQLQDHISKCVQGYLAETGEMIPPPNYF
jgi:hypothetical protein